MAAAVNGILDDPSWCVQRVKNPDYARRG